MTANDPVPNDMPAQIRALEARTEALSATVKSVLATLVLRGLLNRADVAALLRETEALLEAPAHPAALEELKTIEREMPGYLRAAVGPAPDPDEDDH